MKMSKRYHSGTHFKKKKQILIERGAIFRKNTKKSQQDENMTQQGSTQRGPCEPKGRKCETVDTFYDNRDSRLMFLDFFRDLPHGMLGSGAITTSNNKRTGFGRPHSAAEW